MMATNNKNINRKKSKHIMYLLYCSSGAYFLTNIFSTLKLFFFRKSHHIDTSSNDDEI